MRRLYISTLFCILLVSSYSLATNKDQIYKNNFLENKIYSSKSKEFVNKNNFYKILSDYDIIYLAETHNNSQQHDIQSDVINKLIKMGLNPSVGFEFFSNDDTGYLMNFVENISYYKSMSDGGINLRQQLGWEKKDDILWNYYFELILLAGANGLKIFGLDIPKALNVRIRGSGMERISEFERLLLNFTGYSDPVFKEYLLEQFTIAHSGWSEAGLLERLYDTWVARNDTMAISITNIINTTEGTLVVIIGKGHTAYNMGVYNIVEKMNPAVKQINVGFTETNSNHEDLQYYTKELIIKGNSYGMSYDFLWFTRAQNLMDNTSSNLSVNE